MYQIDPGHPVHIHFIGIGGVSMSGLARILQSRGFSVSGSDRDASEATQALEARGIPVAIGQRAENIRPGIDAVVYTAAIHPDNPELAAAREAGLPLLTRAQLLGQIMRLYGCSAAVAGTHGKTTTTSMLSEILLAADLDPTLSVGGVLPSIGGNVRVGGDRYFVAEACEYTNSFLEMFPDVAIILNVDADHLDFFKDLDDIRRSFARFASLVPAEGTLVINKEIPDWQALTEGAVCRIVTFGQDPEADYYPSEIRFDDLGHPAFLLNRKQGQAQPIALSVPGIHNVLNACAAIAAADVLGVDPAVSAAAASAYRGTDRRFQIISQEGGVTVVDDYAHHPTEIAATLRAAREFPHTRIVCAFQPHTYSRTKALLPEFAEALSMADEVFLAPVYAARETDTLGVSSETLAGEIRGKGHACTAFPDLESLREYLQKNCRKGDLLITMGAGNIGKIAPELHFTEV